MPTCMDCGNDIIDCGPDGELCGPGTPSFTKLGEIDLKAECHGIQVVVPIRVLYKQDPGDEHPTVRIEVRKR